jgi:AcrR family transcriptional regulator
VIIRATLGLIESKGFSAITVSAVAAASGVSRQTVYTNFGDREELVSQAVIAAMTDMLHAISAATAGVDTACGYVVELIVTARRELRRQPALLALLRAERNNPLFDEGMIDRAVAVARTQLTPLITLAPALADPDEFDSMVEWVTRMGMSTAVFDSERIRSDDQLRALLTRWLAPLIPD